MDKLHLLPLCFLSLIAVCFAVIGQNDCVDKRDGCLDCAKTYTISLTHLAQPKGCYKSRGNVHGNALDYNSLINCNSKINREMWNKTGDASQIISECCGKRAVEKKVKYFGIEYDGECYFDNEIKGQGLVAAKDCIKFCEWDVGKGHHMMVYEVISV